MDKLAPELSEKKQDIVNSILGDMPTDSSVIVNLPSEAKFYTLREPGAPITLRPMSFEDEKMLLAQNPDDPLMAVISRCLSNVNVEELYPMDKLYLLMKLREISYGDDYKVLLVCPHCSTENPTTIHLSQLNINPIPDDFEDPRSVMLPGIKKTAVVRSTRLKDEKFIKTSLDTLQQLWRLVVSIDGVTDRQIVSDVIAKLPIKDVKTILKAIKTDYGVETKIKLECKECKKQSVQELPLDANFFNVS